MKLLLTSFLVILTSLSRVYGQLDSLANLEFDFEEFCNDNFSMKGDDSLFVNYYISNYEDTIFFKSAWCILTPVPTSPTTFQRRILNGLAEGY